MRRAASRQRGSSPLTRGKHAGGVPAGAQLRLIPAHAGKTKRTIFRLAARQAHPRSRGENAARLALRMTSTGSSPLTRGKPLLRGRRTKQLGLIPAHAGKTSFPYLRSAPLRAHPRSRGENLVCFDRTNCISGSSPLTRGKRGGANTMSFQERLIPAHAGKTNLAKHLDGLCWAHPRSRGENDPATGRGHHPNGSSPLTRGKHHCHP